MLRTFKLKNKSTLRTNFSDWTMASILLLLFFVNLEPQANKRDIYDIKNVCFHIINVEYPREKTEVP